MQKKSIYFIGSIVYLFDNLIKINKTKTMFLRLFIFIFAINTLIPSAMALGGLASDSKMLMTDSEQITMSDSSDTNKTKMQMKMSCYSHTDCKIWIIVIIPNAQVVISIITLNILLYCPLP